MTEVGRSPVETAEEIARKNIEERANRVRESASQKRIRRRERGPNLERAVAGAYERTVMALDDNAAKKAMEMLRPVAYSAAKVVRFGAKVADVVLGGALLLSRSRTVLGSVGRLGGGILTLSYEPVNAALRVGARATGAVGEFEAKIVNRILGRKESPVQAKV